MWMKDIWKNRNEEKLTHLHTFIDCILQQVLFGWMGDWNGPDMQHVSRKQMHTKYGLENCTNQLKEHVTHGRIILKNVFNKLYDFNNLMRESSGRLQQSGESVKFHYNMVYLAHLGFLKEILYLAISIHDAPLFISTIMFCTLQLWWLESMWDDDLHDKT